MFIKFISLAKKQEWQRDGNYLANYDFGNLIMQRYKLVPFFFNPEYTGDTFILQKGNFNVSLQSVKWNDAITLDNSYQQTGYFNEYDFTTNLDAGIYRILNFTKNLQSDIIFKVINSAEISSNLNGELTDSVNNNFGDSNNNIFVTNL